LHGGFNSSGRNAPIPRDQVIDVLRNLNVRNIVGLNFERSVKEYFRRKR
jgi:hypothetical protein